MRSEAMEERGILCLVDLFDDSLQRGKLRASADEENLQVRKPFSQARCDLTEQKCSLGAIGIQTATEDQARLVRGGSFRGGRHLNSIGNHGDAVGGDVVGLAQIVLQILADGNGGRSPSGKFAQQRSSAKTGMDGGDQRDLFLSGKGRGYQCRDAAMGMDECKGLRTQQSFELTVGREQMKTGTKGKAMMGNAIARQGICQFTARRGDGDRVPSLPQGASQRKNVSFRSAAMQCGGE